MVGQLEVAFLGIADLRYDTFHFGKLAEHFCDVGVRSALHSGDALSGNMPYTHNRPDWLSSSAQ